MKCKVCKRPLDQLDEGLCGHCGRCWVWFDTYAFVLYCYREGLRR